MLTHASDQKESFNVVCPSIPGYGFSDAPQKEGFVFVLINIFVKYKINSYQINIINYNLC